MSLAHTAVPIDGQPCRYCTHFGGQAWGDASVIWCLREGRRVVSRPERGCAVFMRLTGVDDDYVPPFGRDDGEPKWAQVAPPSPTRPRASLSTPHRSMLGNYTSAGIGRGHPEA